jgi:hypothetical protein
VSLVGSPNLEDEADETRMSLLEAADTVAEKDPEFVLKVTRLKNILKGFFFKFGTFVF